MSETNKNKKSCCSHHKKKDVEMETEEKTVSFIIKPRSSTEKITCFDVHETFSELLTSSKSFIIEHEMDSVWEIKVDNFKQAQKFLSNSDSTSLGVKFKYDF